MERCAALAKITEKPGEILRTFLSPEMDEVHQAMRPWMEAAGMAVRVDRAGNLRGVWGDEAAPRLLIGSHLDTVPDAGAYDGILGVLMGVAVVEACGEGHSPFAIEVLGFSDEEGTRFGVPFLGSRAAVGELSEELLAHKDTRGISIAEAMRDFVTRSPECTDARLSEKSASYLEFHIEQGPVLENKGLALGVVEGLAGQSRSRVEFRGMAAHAGTTPMKLRKDALAGAAEWMVATERLAARADNAVATVGQIAAEPGAVNVVPGVVRCSLDVRAADNAVRTALVQSIVEKAHTIASKRGLQVVVTQYHEQAAARFDTKLVEMLERAVEKAGYPTTRITGGAGHDAMIVANHVPTAMMFLRNPGGISHHPEEKVAEDDVVAAIDAAMYFLEELAVEMQAKKGWKNA